MKVEKTSSLPDSYDMDTILSMDTAQQLLDGAEITDTYMNYTEGLLSDQFASGALIGVRNQTTAALGNFNVVETGIGIGTFAPAIAAIPLTPLTVRHVYADGGASVDTNMLKMNASMIQGDGYSLTKTALSAKISMRADSQGSSARVSAVDTQTRFLVNDQYSLVGEVSGVSSFQPEKIACVAVASLERLAVIAPNQQTNDAYVSATGIFSGDIDGFDPDFRISPQFIANRSGYLPSEQYGYNVGINSEITAEAVYPGGDMQFALYTQLSVAQDQGDEIIAIPGQVLNALGNSRTGLALAIVLELFSCWPVYPVGIRSFISPVVSTTLGGYFTHNAENLRIPGVKRVAVLLPSAMTSNGTVPGTIAAANLQGQYTVRFGMCPTSNGILPLFPDDPDPEPEPTAAGEAMDYVAPYSARSNFYNLTALFASFMNSPAPARLSDYLTVYRKLDQIVPFINTQRYFKPLVDLLCWRSQSLVIDRVIGPPTFDPGSRMVDYSGGFGGVVSLGTIHDLSARFTLKDSFTRAFTHMMMGLLQPMDPTEKWASSVTIPGGDGGYTGSIDYSNLKIAMFGRRTFLAAAASWSLVTYGLGVSGDEICASQAQYGSNNPMTAAVARGLDATSMGQEQGAESQAQLALRIAYAAVTKCKMGTDQNGLTPFGRIYIGMAEDDGINGYNKVFSNGEFIPSAITSVDFFFFTGKMVRDFAFPPVADVYKQSLYLRLGDVSTTIAPGLLPSQPAFLSRSSTARMLTRPPAMGDGLITDADVAYNINLWASQFVGAGAPEIGVKGNVTGVKICSGVFLYSQPMRCSGGRITRPMRLNSYYPRRSVNEFSIVIAGGNIPNYQDLIMQTYVSNIPQPRESIIMQPFTVRPTNIYQTGGTVPGFEDLMRGSMARFRSKNSVVTSIMTEASMTADSAIMLNTGSKDALPFIESSALITRADAHPVGSGNSELAPGVQNADV